MKRTWAVVPVKSRERAKERLREALAAEERALLVTAMLADVLAALTAARLVAGVAVQSTDHELLALARGWGAEVLLESAALGYHAAADAAARLAEARGWEALLVLPADVPLLTARDVDELIALNEAHPRGVVLCPDRAQRGTNALLRRPPACIAAQFGPDSLLRHQQAARAAGLTCRVWLNPNLALDVDTPDDLRLVLDRGGGPATRRALAQLGIAERFPRLAASGAGR